MSIKDRLNNTTGVQRLFLVSLALFWMYFGIFESFNQASKSNRSNTEFTYNLSKDLDNPDCKPYTYKPFSELKKPAFSDTGGNCHFVYLTRTGSTPVKLPITLEFYEQEDSANYRELLAMYFGIYTAAVALFFALIFVIYRVGSWVVAGFRK